MRRVLIAFAAWGALTALTYRAILWLGGEPGMERTTLFILIACGVLVLLPPSLDPAIQLKERLRR